MDYSIAIWTLAIPLLVFLLLGLNYNRIKAPISGWIGCLGMTLTTLISYALAFGYFLTDGPQPDGYPSHVTRWRWMSFTEDLFIDMGILLDQISIMMLVVVSTISTMVHVYSLGYMKGEAGFTKFYAFLSLFTFSMMGLVLSVNIFQIYIFWELVGVSSFLLIGFYYQKPSAVAAAKKAFIVTRFADLGFLIGILVLGYYGGSFDFQALMDPQGTVMSSWAEMTFMGTSVFTWALALIFMGGAGKSAMFPLHIWLPDAMEGPTPVSALIHAATMVVAGVYLVARLFPLYFEVDQGAILNLVAWVGAFSALFAALIALTQNDIKRVLAYSTMSQIGYMMLALGVSGYIAEEGLGYTASMFHLFTHAMFKALLFLGAGSVIHAVHSNLMQEMGGLRRHMPLTHLTFLIAALSISGLPLFAGFFSKDEILAAVYADNKLLYFLALGVAGLTAFYMFRLYFRIFWYQEKDYAQKPHESPWIMTIPLMILAVLSVVTGYIPFGKYVSADGYPFALHLNWSLAGIATLVSLTGIGLAAVFYRKASDYPERVTKAFGQFYTWTYHKFYFDELYLFVTKQLIFKRISTPFAWFDRKVVDGTMNAIGNGTVEGSRKIRKIQSGRLQDYAFAFLLGAIFLSALLMYNWIKQY